MYIFLTVYFCISEIFKINFSKRFYSTKSPFNLCFRVVNSQWLFCSKKSGVKCSYERFLVYKEFFGLIKVYSTLL